MMEGKVCARLVEGFVVVAGYNIFFILLFYFFDFLIFWKLICRVDHSMTRP
jgi:hypothetical protein